MTYDAGDDVNKTPCGWLFSRILRPPGTFGSDLKESGPWMRISWPLSIRMMRGVWILALPTEWANPDVYYILAYQWTNTGFLGGFISDRWGGGMNRCMLQLSRQRCWMISDLLICLEWSISKEIRIISRLRNSATMPHLFVSPQDI